MPFLPTYGSVFCYGASSSPDKMRLSGPSPAAYVADNSWYGTAGDYGPTVDNWYNVTHPGYPAGPPVPGDPTWVPNPSWLIGVNLPDGTYTRIIRSRWNKFV